MRKKRTAASTPIVVHIEALSHEGRGISRPLLADGQKGKTLFVSGALPGETVSVQIERRHGRYEEGRALEVLEHPHPDRIAPPCAVFERCGGCSFQHWTIQAQLAHKQESLRALFLQQGIVVDKALEAPSLTVDPWHYRSKARLGVRFVPEKGGVLLGFRERASNKITPTDRCLILEQPFGDQLGLLRACIEGLSIAQQIAQVEIALLPLAEASLESAAHRPSVPDPHSVLIIRHLAPLSSADKEHLRGYAEAYGWTILLQSGGPQTVCDLEGHPPALCCYTLSIGARPLRLELHPLDFSQVNRALNQKMVLQALEWLGVLDSSWGSDKSVVEFFCGIGNFSLPLGLYFQKVLSIEGVEAMVQRARSNAALNGIDHIDFLCADLFVEEHFAAIKARLLGAKAGAESRAQGWPRVDAVLLDPPRSGARALMDVIGALEPQKVLYIACDPATCARDCAILIQQYGYQLDKMGIMDMFSQTAHVESMILLTRKGHTAHAH